MIILGAPSCDLKLFIMAVNPLPFLQEGAYCFSQYHLYINKNTQAIRNINFDT